MSDNKKPTQKDLWKNNLLEYLHNCFIGISNLTCSEENCPLVLEWGTIERKNSKKGKCAFYLVSKTENKWLVVDLVDNPVENDLGTYNNIEIEFKSGKKQRTKPKDYQEQNKSLPTQTSGWNSQEKDKKEIFLKDEEIILFFNNSTHTPNLQDAETIYLDDLWETKAKIKWDQDKSKKKVFLFCENDPSDETQSKKIDASEKDYLFYISDPSITNTIKDYEVYSPSQGKEERKQLWTDYKEELSELKEVYGIRHNTGEKEEILFPENPTFTQWLKEQPHLWDHTTFQFYLFNKNTMSANGRYLGIKEKNGKFVLPYKLFINCAPGALYYRWQFGFIYVKLEISTQGNFQDYTNPMRFMQGFNFKIEGGLLGTGGGFGMGMNWNSSNADKAGKSEAKEDPKAEQEAQTERMFKSTFRDFVGKSVEPAMFNANTIDFNYSLGEFFNRLTDPIWFYRCEISELLKNKLSWCNNKSPILNLPLSWKELGTWTQKAGEWKWSNVSLQKDTNNFFTNIMNRGYYLDDGQELKNPNLAFAHADSHIQVGGNAWNITQAEEEVTETREKVKHTLINSDITNADYGNADYIGSPNSNIWEELNRANNNIHVGNSPFPNNCLGCLCGGGSHGNPNYNFSRTFHFTNGGKLVLKTRGSGSQECIIPEQGGEVVFSAQGNSATITLEYEKVTRTVKIKKDPNPIKQEIDKEKLENEVEDEQVEEMEGENEDEMNKELGGDKEKEAEPEQEGETEQEKEDEKEEETEQEQENEKEDEQEQEGEKEEEKEDEKESESEDEGEGENEGEGES